MKSAFALLLLQSGAAVAAPAYSDCAVPGPPAREWHIDAVKGTPPPTGNGSAAHPFGALAAVFQKGISGYPNYPLLSTIAYDHYPQTQNGQRVYADGPSDNPQRIQPGDAIVIHSGDYGNLNLGVYAQQTANVDATGATKFVTIEGAPGEIPPRFTTLAVSAAIGFVVSNVRIVSLRTEGASNQNSLALVTGGTDEASQTRDIIVQNSYLGSADSLPPWSQADWRAKPRSSAMRVIGSASAPQFTRCVTVQNNRLNYIGSSGLSVSQATHTTFSQNEVRYFTGDGIDIYSASEWSVIGNRVSDRIDAGDGIHPDGIQLAFAGSNNGKTWTDGVIKDNTFIRQTDPKLPFRGFLQGMLQTNETWERLTVTGNTVVTQACWGLSFGTTFNSLFANNSFAWDGSPAVSGCAGLFFAMAAKNKVVNNVVTGGMSRPSCTDGAEWASNLAVRSIVADSFATTPSSVCKSGQYIKYAGAGVYDGITVDYSTPMDQVWANYAPSADGVWSGDLTPAPGGLLYGTGVPVSTPNIGAK